MEFWQGCLLIIVFMSIGPMFCLYEDGLAPTTTYCTTLQESPDCWYKYVTEDGYEVLVGNSLTDKNLESYVWKNHNKKQMLTIRHGLLKDSVVDAEGFVPTPPPPGRVPMENIGCK